MTRLPCSPACSSTSSTIINPNPSSALSLQILHSPCCASGWVLVSGSMLNSQGGERPDQHTHILGQSWLFAHNYYYNYCFILPSALCCSLQSELLALVWALQPASSAQLSLLPPRYICLNEPLSGKRGERVREREREHNRVQNGREERERERSSFHIVVVVERERGRERWVERVVAMLSFHFDQFYTQHIFFSPHKEKINILQELRNLYSAPVLMLTMRGLTQTSN